MSRDTTLELDAEDLRARVRAARGAVARVADHGGCSERGRHRPDNQDAYDADGSSWFVVADGMGGHEGGRQAAQSLVAAVRTLADDDTAPSAAAAIEQVAAAVRTRAAGTNMEGMGTTLVLLHVPPASPPVLVHLGDSRAYLWRSGDLRLLTRDHTVEVELEDAGRDATELAARGVRVDALTGYVGGRRLVGEPSRRELSVHDGDRVLLCSDGVYRPLEEGERLALVLAEVEDQTCEEAAATLVARALESGGTDNATAVVVDLAVAT